MSSFLLDTWRPHSKKTYFRYCQKTRRMQRQSWSWASYEIKLILLVCFVKSISILFYLGPMSDVTRIAMFDFHYMWNVTSLLHVVIVMLSLPGIYVCYTIYFNSKCFATHRWANQSFHSPKSGNVSHSLWRQKVFKKVKKRYLRFISEAKVVDISMLIAIAIQAICGKTLRAEKHKMMGKNIYFCL